MRKLLSLGIVVGLLATACAAYAYPSLAGWTGTGVLPTAAVAPAGQFQVAADFYNAEDTVGQIPADSAFPIRLLYGLGSRVEFGAGFTFQQAADNDANTWNVNAKWLTPLTPLGFDWSLGARYASTDLSILDVTANTTNVYFVGTRNFSGNDDMDDTTNMPGINGTVGVNWTSLSGDVTDEDGFRVFGGLELMFNKFSLSADVQSELDEFDTNALYSIAARYPFGRTIAAQVGYTNADATGINGSDNSNIFAGLKFAFGGPSTDDETYGGAY